MDRSRQRSPPPRQPHAVGRIGHHHTRIRRWRKFEHVTARDTWTQPENPAAAKILAGTHDLVFEHIRNRLSPEAVMASGAPARPHAAGARGPGRHASAFRTANSRPSPGAMSSAICAASKRKVPLPHIDRPVLRQVASRSTAGCPRPGSLERRLHPGTLEAAFVQAPRRYRDKA